MASAKNQHFAEGLHGAPSGARWAVGLVIGWGDEITRPPLSAAEDQQVANYMTGSVDTGISHIKAVGNRNEGLIGARALLFTSRADNGMRPLEQGSREDIMALRREIALEKGLSGLVGALAHVGASRSELVVVSAQVLEIPRRGSTALYRDAFSNPDAAFDTIDANDILSEVINIDTDLLRQIALASR